MSRKTLILDSSQIESFLTCNQLWNLKYQENLTLSTEVREDMAMGTYGHKLLEIYYTALALGKTVQQAVALAQSFHLEGDFPLSAEMREKVSARFNDYWMIYCANDIIPALGAPIPIIRFREHKYLFNNQCEICGDKNFIEGDCPNRPYTKMEPKPLVEQGFSYELLNTPEYLFVLEGRIDLIGTLSGQNCWLDHKFQGRKRDLYSKSIQFRNYSLVTDLSLGIINYIRMAKTIEKDTLTRHIVSFSSKDRREWKQELIEIFVTIVRDMELSEYTKNRSACPGKFGYPCEFTKICEETNPVTIQAIKSINYKEKEKWTPW